MLASVLMLVSDCDQINRVVTIDEAERDAFNFREDQR